MCKFKFLYCHSKEKLSACSGVPPGGPLLPQQEEAARTYRCAPGDVGYSKSHPQNRPNQSHSNYCRAPINKRPLQSSQITPLPFIVPTCRLNVKWQSDSVKVYCGSQCWYYVRAAFLESGNILYSLSRGR